MTANLIIDVPGVRVGSAHDMRLASGVTAVIFEDPATASIAVHGGGPASRDTELLAPHMTVERVDGFVLSGGSAFGLDAAGGAMAHLATIGRGYPVRGTRVPIVPGASLFDLLNGGDKVWGRMPPYWELGFRAAAAASPEPFPLGTVGAGVGATTFDLKGGLGSASAISSRGFCVGALVACNAVGRTTRGARPYFWASPYERDAEFGGLGAGPEDNLALETGLKSAAQSFGSADPDAPLGLALKNDAPANTNLVVVAVDASLTKAQAKRVAIMAQDGLALAIRPAHAPSDGDIAFAAATGRAAMAIDITDLTEIGMLAAECVARAVARGVYEASPLAVEGAQPSWRERYGR
jgi:D-aminopeptidase